MSLVKEIASRTNQLQRSSLPAVEETKFVRKVRTTLHYANCSTLRQKIQYTTATSTNSDWGLIFEPDGYYLTCWIRPNTLTNIYRDYSDFGNVAFFSTESTNPQLTDGYPPTHDAALVFDGLTEWLDVADDLTIDISNMNVGFSVFARFWCCTFSDTDPTSVGAYRRVASKRDQNGMGWALVVEPNGNMKFTVRTGDNSVPGSIQDQTCYAPGVIQPRKWYEVWGIWIATAPTQPYLIVNGMPFSNPYSNHAEMPNDAGCWLHIGRSSSTTNNLFCGLITDFRFYREYCVVPTEAQNLMNNYWSISPVKRAVIMGENWRFLNDASTFAQGGSVEDLSTLPSVSDGDNTQVVVSE